MPALAGKYIETEDILTALIELRKMDFRIQLF